VKELLPLVLGIAVGVSLRAVPRSRLRGILLAAATVLAGASASAVNGEVKDEWWWLFVSIDTLIVGLGVIASSASLVVLGSLRRSGQLRERA
jgi:hypothetical protein